MTTKIAVHNEEHLALINNTRHDFPRNETIPSLFAKIVQSSGEQIAVKDESRSLSYASLDAESTTIAAHIQATLPPGDGRIVALLLERSCTTVAAMLATLKCGHAYLPLDPGQPIERLKGIVADSGAAMVLATDKFLAVCSQALPNLPTVLLDDESKPEKHNDTVEAHVAPTSVAYIMYTASSTGKPNAVRTTHRNIISMVCNAGCMSPNADTVTAFHSPLLFDVSTFEIYAALLNGDRVVIPTRAGILDRARASALEWDAEWKVNHEHVEATNALLREQEQRNVPIEIDECGHRFVVRPGVFAPGVTFFGERLPELVRGSRRFLEVGCGCGYIAILVALDSPSTDVHAVDISQDAVENTKLNAARHNISSSRFHVKQSDVFDGVERPILFDTIFWNWPWEHTEKDVLELTPLERAVRDPFYAAFRRYVTEAHDLLTADGRLMVGFSPDVGTQDAVIAIAKSAGWPRVKFLVAQEKRNRSADGLNSMGFSECIVEFLRDEESNCSDGALN